MHFYIFAFAAFQICFITFDYLQQGIKIHPYRPFSALFSPYIATALLQIDCSLQFQCVNSSVAKRDTSRFPEVPPAVLIATSIPFETGLPASGT